MSRTKKDYYYIIPLGLVIFLFSMIVTTGFPEISNILDKLVQSGGNAWNVIIPVMLIAFSMMVSLAIMAIFISGMIITYFFDEKTKIEEELKIE